MPAPLKCQAEHLRRNQERCHLCFSASAQFWMNGMLQFSTDSSLVIWGGLVVKLLDSFWSLSASVHLCCRGSSWCCCVDIVILLMLVLLDLRKRRKWLLAFSVLSELDANIYLLPLLFLPLCISIPVLLALMEFCNTLNFTARGAFKFQCFPGALSFW